GYLEIGLLADAEKIFTSIVKTTDNPECRQKSIISISRIDIDRGDTEKAQERLNILLYGGKVLASVTDEANHILGDACFLDKKYKEAIDAYSVAMKDRDAISLRQARSLLRLGEAFGRTGYYYNGIQALKKLTAIAGRVQPQGKEIAALTQEAHLLIGDYQCKKGNYNAAIASYRELTLTGAEDEKKGWAFLKWGDALVQKGDYDNATKMFTQVAEKMPYTSLKNFAQSRITGIKWQKNMQSDLQEFM
ncbi:MAG: tetratricopeptide repeat protein, partial [Pseudomonadota bacterium]